MQWYTQLKGNTCFNQTYPTGLGPLDLPLQFLITYKAEGTNFWALVLKDHLVLHCMMGWASTMMKAYKFLNSCDFFLLLPPPLNQNMYLVYPHTIYKLQLIHYLCYFYVYVYTIIKATRKTCGNWWKLHQKRFLLIVIINLFFFYTLLKKRQFFIKHFQWRFSQPAA